MSEVANSEREPIDKTTLTNLYSRINELVVPSAAVKMPRGHEIQMDSAYWLDPLTQITVTHGGVLTGPNQRPLFKPDSEYSAVTITEFTPTAEDDGLKKITTLVIEPHGYGGIQFEYDEETRPGDQYLTETQRAEIRAREANNPLARVTEKQASMIANGGNELANFENVQLTQAKGFELQQLLDSVDSAMRDMTVGPY
jgi:hypothetical protein